MAKEKAQPKTATKAKSATKGQGTGPKKQHIASIYPGPSKPLSEDLAKILLQAQKEIDLPLWLLIQSDSGVKGTDILGPELWKLFVSNENELPKGEPVALVVDSPGGHAKEAYQIARLFTKRCGSFTAVVPRYAKSAATLLVFGADKIVMGRHAELGPLDAQMGDPEREEIFSALEVVHSLERLHAFAMESLDRTMLFMLHRTGKKVETLLPHILKFTADMMTPLLSNIDVVEYTKMSRILKVAEEYAVRLLTNNMLEEEARRIASHLVEHYPDHPFFIAPEEARRIGLPIENPSKAIDTALDDIYHHLQTEPSTILGQVKEIPTK